MPELCKEQPAPEEPSHCQVEAIEHGICGPNAGRGGSRVLCPGLLLYCSGC